MESFSSLCRKVVEVRTYKLVESIAENIATDILKQYEVFQDVR